jgi:5'-deoxynucleotidase YfbR-like HD superfamily hydrolase
MRKETTSEAAPETIEELFDKYKKYDDKANKYYFTADDFQTMRREPILSLNQREGLGLYAKAFIEKVNLNLNDTIRD